MVHKECKGGYTRNQKRGVLWYKFSLGFDLGVIYYVDLLFQLSITCLQFFIKDLNAFEEQKVTREFIARVKAYGDIRIIRC